MNEVPEGSFVISPAEQFARTNQQFGEISKELQHLTVTMSGVPAQLSEHDAYINLLRQVGLPQAVTDLRADVNRIDRQQAKWLGAFGAVGLIGGLLGAYLPMVIH